MERTHLVRVLEVIFHTFLKYAIYLVVLGFSVYLFFIFQNLFAAGGQINPNGSGNTTQGTRTTCATANNFDCVNDGISTTSTPSTSGDFITFSRNQLDSYQLETISNVSSATRVDVYMYHVESSVNFQFQVSLWDAAETTQVGTTQNLPILTSSGWSSVSFTGLSLNQAALDALRVRTTCTRPGSGNGTCTDYALYAFVTYTPVTNVTVSTLRTQKNLDIGTTTAYVGGAFSIVENTSSRNITSITIAETGTVDAQTNLSNVQLRYEMDSVAPYDCASVSYNGTEPLFGSAQSFNGANGSATFSTSTGRTITTTSALCVYPVLSVSSNAGIAETVEIQITNPNTDVLGTGSPYVQPSSAVAISETTNLLKSSLQQMRYHWRNDDGLENNPGGATSATGGTENTVLSAIAQLQGKRLRIEVSNEGNATSTAKQYRIEYLRKTTTCATTTGWTNIAAVGGDWDMYSSSQLTEAGNTTDIATSIGGVTNENTSFLSSNGGQRESTSQTGSLTLTSTQFVELEYAIAPTASATEGNTYCFRLSDQGQSLDSYGVYPEATISADLSVSATGTQKTSVPIPLSDVNLGGGFVITDSTSGPHSIKSVTIHASGTVDLQNDIDNIELWYETDTSSPYNCTGESFNGDETQYGITVTNGFSATSTAWFTGSTSVSTTQGVCLYVVYDVTASSTNGETFDVHFSNPSQDIVVDTGTKSPTSQLSIPGVTTFVNDNLTQIHYHWRNDDGVEGAGGATSATNGSQDTALTSLTKNSPIRLRLEVSNEGGTTSPAVQYRLEYAQKVTTCSAASSWTDVGAAGGDFDMANSANLTNGNDTTNIATSTGGVANENTTFLTPNGGVRDTTSQTGNITLTSTQYVELEYSIRASTSVSSGATYCFRLTNAGTSIDTYTVYPEATIKLDTDFFVQRGVSTLTGSTVTLTAGVDYQAPSASTSAFIRITNTHHTGAGDSGAAGNQNADSVTAYITNPSNIMSSITFQRGASPSGDTRIAWEIVEYKGSPSGENEFIVRRQGISTYTATGATVNTPTVSGVVDDADVLPFITAQFNPDGGRNDYNTGLSTSAWNSGSDTATFTRGEDGSDAVIVSYAVVEFTGSNWRVQRAEHTFTSAGSTETQSISSVGSLSRAFVHAQKHVGSGLSAHEDYGHEVWLSGINQVSFLLDSGANTPSGHTSVAWVIENTQTQGDIMVVSHASGTQSGGVAPFVSNINIGATLADLTVSSIFMNNRSSGTGSSWPEPMIATRLISTTQYEIWISDTSDTRNYRTEVVEWPTARRKITQNYYRLYVNNNALDPTDPWSDGGAINLGENTEMTGLDDPIASGESIRIRMSIVPSGAAMPPGVDAFKLQYAPRSTSCSAISSASWRNLGDIGSTTALWRGHAGTPVDGTALSGDPPTSGELNLSVADIIGVAGTYEENNPTALTPFLALVGENIEFDWSIENNGATEKTDYCFRMLEGDNTEFLAYNFYPVVRTAGYGVQSQAWRWYDDAENETPIDDLAATNSAPIDIEYDNTLQLRITLREVNGASEQNTKFRLEFSEYSSFSTSTSVAESDNCTEFSYWCYADGGSTDNATITTKTLGDANACSGGIGNGCGTHNESGTSTSQFVHDPGEAKEYAFTIRHAGARVNRVYYFRLYDEANDEYVILGNGQSYPSLVTEGASLTFEILGVNSGVFTESITTDVSSTPTTISYGEINQNTELKAAHRVRVTTNATEGYQILMYSGQSFLNTYGEAIEQVSGTNASPSIWNTGCINSCYGYHAGDDLLGSGNTTRFSAPDTYARFSTTTPEEVAHSSIPVVNETTDIVYRLRVNELQQAGEYETNVVYIAVPIF